MKECPTEMKKVKSKGREERKRKNLKVQNQAEKISLG